MKNPARGSGRGWVGAILSLVRANLSPPWAW